MGEGTNLLASDQILQGGKSTPHRNELSLEDTSKAGLSDSPEKTFGSPNICE